MTKFTFQPDKENNELATTHGPVWNILIVDDEPSVHDVTRLVLSHLNVFGRSIKLFSAFSAEEAQIALRSDTVFCMAFVDVVMEDDKAGLNLVDWIRNELENNQIRLVLRTGQAGQAPESEVIKRYDINDYKTKTELTHVKLTSVVYSSIRSFRDITTISNSLEAFQRLIESSINILKVNDLSEFASAALNNLLSLMDIQCSSVYIVRHETDFYEDRHEIYLACSGRFGTTPEGIESIPFDVKAKVEEVFVSQTNVFTDEYFIGFFKTSAQSGSVLYIEFNEKPTQFKSNIAELFSTNLALILESLVKQKQFETSQRELLYIVGDAIEARSKETGSHVKRVALMCACIAEKLGCSESFISALRMAAPLHDIGKIMIPERVLHKPSKLDDAEWQLMQTHADAGASLLEQSNLPIAQMGSRLAHWHHENWDGTGYPDQLKGEEIPLEARIMSIVDVFDALGSKRSYKNAWGKNEIVEFIEEQRGKKFQPELVDVVLEHADELMDIRLQLPD